MSNKVWDKLSYAQSEQANLNESQKKYDKLLKERGYKEHDDYYKHFMCMQNEVEELRRMRECSCSSGCSDCKCNKEE